MIRRAQNTDWPAIVRLLEQLDYPDTAKFMEARLAQLLSDPAEILLVWEQDSPANPAPGATATPSTPTAAPAPILGLLSLHFIPQIALPGDFARISYFSIDETARGNGLGAQMEEHATQLAREKGCELIEVHCHTRREKAHAFYFRQGYEESPKYLVKRL
ncbi:MAG TPA: GNAT family N-acetyltransferase [Puia sp.]|nr:GNAT family N-acetyltransferase [Puia sp.]